MPGRSACIVHASRVGFARPWCTSAAPPSRASWTRWRLRCRGGREAKVRGLLADLLLSLGRSVPTGQLIDDLWGADLPAHPAGALQLKVSRLRQALEAAEPGGGALVAFRSSGYQLQAGSDALDERLFAALVERAAAAGDHRDRAGLLADALGLWRGPPPAGLAHALFAPPPLAPPGEAPPGAAGEQGATPPGPGRAHPPA